MKLKRIVAGLVSVLAVQGTMAQNEVLSTAPVGYLSRGAKMYESGNYNGAIDQLTHLQDMWLNADEKEQSDFLIAASLFRRGETTKALQLLSRFVTDYPTSFRLPKVYATVGDIYFYDGQFASAVTAYRLVNLNALTTSQSEDVIYRLAYAELRVKEGDKMGGKVLTSVDVETLRKQALADFETLSASHRYRDAAKFYKAYTDYERGDLDKALEAFNAIDRNSELGYVSQYYTTQIYYTQGNIKEVISIGTELLEDKNSYGMDGEISRIVGESYFRNGEDNNAAKHLYEYLASTTDTPMVTAQYILGVLNFRNADFNNAIEHLNAVTQEDNIIGQSAHYYLGQCYRKQNNISRATMAFEKAAKQEYSKSTQEAALYNFGVMQNEGGRTPFGNAIGMFEDFLNKFPKSKYADEVNEYMTALYVTGNNYEKALASISRIKSPSEKVLKAKQVVLYNLGVSELSDNRTSEARKHLLEARKLAKYDRALDAQNSLWLGECHFRTGDYAQAAKYQNEYLKAASNNDSNKAIACYNLGYSHFMQKNYTEARNAFTKAISSKLPSKQLTDDANNRIGDTYYYAKDFKTARKFYEKSSGDYSLFQKGMMQGLAKDYSGKVAQMKELRKKFPGSTLIPTAMLEEADAYVSMNNSKKAVEVYDELIEKYPDNAYARKAMLNKAITERNAKNETAAISSYKEVIKKYPTSDEAALALEDLKIIYAEKGELAELTSFIASVKNAPKLDVSDIDRLTFEAAEKAYIADNNDIAKMNGYLKSNPDGAYAANAKYYTAKYNYNKGEETNALELINEVEVEAEDASFLEDALAMKAAILVNQGNNKDALATYKKLASKASNADNRLTAGLGIMRTSAALGEYDEVVASANTLLKDGGLTPEEEKEVTFNRGFACYKQGKNDSAQKDFSQLAKDGRNLHGAQSAYYNAEIQFKAGKLTDAENSLNAFIDAGTPHQYWLARCFILLADVYHKQGNEFEACEYLESLKSNYPGEEKDIFSMIDERLNKWKSTSKQN